MDNLNLALTLLIAGFVIVFTVLVLLIIIITLYGKLIQAAQKTSQKRREKKKVVVVENTEKPAEPKAPYIPKVQEDDGEIPGEIVAVIAAAVDALYGEKPHRIRSVKRSGNVRSAWGSTGVMQNTRPF
ncbi:MAG: OadG family protein [Clostridia bacterium]|nr:OadG family protein [Clostridia bacterium]